MSFIATKTFASSRGRSFCVRTANPSEAAEVLSLTKSVLVESRGNILLPEEYGEPESTMRQQIQELQDAPGKLAIIAEAAGEFVGLLKFKNGHVQRLAHRGSFSMSVINSWRREGVGSALLEVLIDWATASPLIEKVSLGVLSTNEPAIKLYKKFNFIEEGRCPKEIKLSSNEYADDILMYRFV